MYQNEGCSWCYEQPIYKENFRRVNGQGQGCQEQEPVRYQGERSSRECCCNWDPCRCCNQEPRWCRCGNGNGVEPDIQNNSRERKDCKCDSDINIYNTIHVCQRGEANGGDANGGDGGDAKGGSAAAANAESNNGGNSGSEASINSGIDRCYRYGEALEAGDSLCARANANDANSGFNNANGSNDAGIPVTPLTPLSNGLELGASIALGDAAAAGGSASGGDGGNGGAGGAGGTVTQTVETTIENVVVINCDGQNGPPGLRFGQNGRTIDIRVDEKGNTLVNGEKMDEKILENGSKVLIVRSDDVKHSEA